MFPARAGMSRNKHMSAEIQSCVPRASGDEPTKAGEPGVPYMCSPRERG